MCGKQEETRSYISGRGEVTMKEQLKQLKYIKSEIEMLKKQIEDIEPVVVTDSVRGSRHYFPYIERSFKIEGIDYENYNRKIERLERRLQRRVDELMDLVEEVNEFIENIDDSLTRQIISLRYVDGLNWRQVAAHIGGGNTADSVRKAAERFLK